MAPLKTPAIRAAGAAAAPVQQASRMSNFIVAALIAAFVIYITAKGELGTWLQFFIYTPPTGSPTATQGTAAPTGSPLNSTVTATQGTPAAPTATVTSATSTSGTSGNTPVTQAQPSDPQSWAQFGQSFLKTLGTTFPPI